MSIQCRKVLADHVYRFAWVELGLLEIDGYQEWTLKIR